MGAATRRRRKVSADQLAERDAQRAAKVDALTDELHAAVVDLADSDAWRRMLDVAGRFHRYSWRNQVLLAMQAEDRGIRLTRVAGFNRWKELGRAVRRAESGLAILAPLKRRLSGEEAAKLAAEGKQAYDSEGRPAMVVRGFRIEYVWDQSQTEPIEGAEQLAGPRSWISQHGDGPEGLWDAIWILIEAEGYAIEHRPPVGGDGSAHGWSDHDRRIVWIRSDVDEAEQIRVAIHELAHVRADHNGRDISRAQGETEADSIAHVVATWAGLDICASSVDYITGWSGGDSDVLEAALAAIHDTATAIIADLEDRAGDAEEQCPAAAETVTMPAEMLESIERRLAESAQPDSPEELASRLAELREQVSRGLRGS